MTISTIIAMIVVLGVLLVIWLSMDRKPRRKVIYVADRYHIECDGINHWYVDDQVTFYRAATGGSFPQTMEPEHTIGPCREEQQ